MSLRTPRRGESVVYGMLCFAPVETTQDLSHRLGGYSLRVTMKGMAVGEWPGQSSWYETCRGRGLGLDVMGAGSP